MKIKKRDSKRKRAFYWIDSFPPKVTVSQRKGSILPVINIEKKPFSYQNPISIIMEKTSGDFWLLKTFQGY